MGSAKKKSAKKTPPPKHVLSIEFDSKVVAKHFATWLCESGEQSYWEWMRYRQREEDGEITAVDFDYHGPKGRGFLSDNTIRTTAGRLLDDEYGEDE